MELLHRLHTPPLCIHPLPKPRSLEGSFFYSQIFLVLKMTFSEILKKSDNICVNTTL